MVQDSQFGFCWKVSAAGACAVATVKCLTAAHHLYQSQSLQTARCCGARTAGGSYWQVVVIALCSDFKCSLRCVQVVDLGLNTVAPVSSSTSVVARCVEVCPSQLTACSCSISRCVAVLTGTLFPRSGTVATQDSTRSFSDLGLRLWCVKHLYDVKARRRCHVAAGTVTAMPHRWAVAAPTGGLLFVESRRGIKL